LVGVVLRGWEWCHLVVSCLVGKEAAMGKAQHWWAARRQAWGQALFLRSVARRQRRYQRARWGWTERFHLRARQVALEAAVERLELARLEEPHRLARALEEALRPALEPVLAEVLEQVVARALERVRAEFPQPAPVLEGSQLAPPLPLLSSGRARSGLARALEPALARVRALEPGWVPEPPLEPGEIREVPPEALARSH
jgi:hypothetical protein